MPEKTVTIARADRNALLRLLAELDTQMGYIITSNTPATTDSEKWDVHNATRIQMEALELATRLRRTK
jgi:hypothetical protein